MDSLTNITYKQPQFEAENEEEALSPGNPTPCSQENDECTNNPYSPILIETEDNMYHQNTNTMLINSTPIATFENEGQSTPQFDSYQTNDTANDTTNDTTNDTANDTTNYQTYEYKNELNDDNVTSDMYIDDKKPKTMTLSEFQQVSIEDLISNDDSLRDHYDIGKKICQYFDSQFADTDTVCMVADSGKQPQMSYWCKGDWIKKYTNICNGKHILIYRACKHIPAKKPIITHKQFEKCVKRIALQNSDKECEQICDLLDKKFGKGCHMARSTSKKPAYDIYSRYSDKYECGFRLPSGPYCIVWRR